ILASDIQRRVLCVRLDEGFSGGNVSAHQHVKNLVRFGGILYIYLLQNTTSWIHSRLPKLFGVHFSKTFVSLNIRLLGPFSRFRFRFFLIRIYDSFPTLFFVDHLLILQRRKTLIFEIFHFFFIGKQVGDLFSNGNFIQRRLSDVDKPTLYQRPEMPVKKSEQERPDVSAVNVRIGGYDYLVVTQLGNIKSIAGRGAKRDYKIFDLPPPKNPNKNLVIPLGTAI